jgi:V8-like Glu-specific endopeptidase
MFSIIAKQAERSEGDSGNTPFTFTVTRTGSLAAPASVDWVVTGSGPNPAGKDFANVLQNTTTPVYPRGTATFAAGQDTATITVQVLGDLGLEPDEGFTVTLTNPSAGTPIGSASASGVIRNDGIFGFGVDNGIDNRTVVATVPFVVAVDPIYGPGKSNVGSGVLISPIHVLTAGHVLADGSSPATGAGITLSSQVSSLSNPRITYPLFLFNPTPNVAVGIPFFPFSYPTSGAIGSDIALQQIQSVGATNANVIPIAVFYDASAVKGLSVTTAGYPATYSAGDTDARLDDNSGRTLYTATGPVSNYNDAGGGRAEITYSKAIDTQGGQSGSGVWTGSVQGEAGPFLVGIHVKGNNDVYANTGTSTATLITKDAYFAISQRMEANYGANAQAEAASLPGNVLVGSNPGFFSFLGFSTGGDYIEGSFRRERIVGLGGDDRMHGGDGDDRYEGGAGVDQALFRDVLGNYTITVTDAGAASFQIEHTGGDRKSGKDAIKETEFAVFEFVDANRDGTDDDGNLLYVPLQVDPKDPTKLKDGPAIKPTTTVRDAQNTEIGSFTADLPAWSFDGDVRYSFTIGPKQGTLFNVALIQDVSGSMFGTALAQSKAAYQALIQSFIDRGIADKSKFAVIPFNSSSQLFAPLTASQALSRINSLSAGGGTAFGPPLSSAAQFFTANPGPTNLAYFVSDGFGSGASTSLQSLANVQAFGLPGADTSGLNIIDTDNAVILNNPADIVTALNTVTIDRSTIDRIEVKRDGTVVSTIAPGQLIDQGAGGFRFEGDLSGLDVSRSANNKIEFVLVFNNGTPSATLQSAITTGQTEIVQQTNNGASVVVTFAVNQANYTPNVGPAQSLVITANDLSNTITTGPAQNSIESFGGDDRIIITPGSSGVVDGGDGIDTAVFGLTRAAAGTISAVGNIVQVGSYNFTNVEFLDFTDVRLATATLQPVPVVSLPLTSITVQEGADIVGRTATFTVVLGTTAASPVTVGIAAAGGSTTAEDFSSLPDSVTIAAGQTTASFSVVVNDDALVEGDETITLALSLTGDAQFRDGSKTALAGVLVADDDTALEIPIAGFNRVLEGDPDIPRDLSLTMIRSGNLDASFDVTYAVTPSGTNPVDAADFPGNILPSGIFTFSAGQSTAEIDIPISGDLDNEPDESFTVNFTLSGTRIAAPKPVEYFIANDDGLTPTNNPPTARDDVITTLQATAVRVPVLANDSDQEGSLLEIIGFSSLSTQGGSLSLFDNATPADFTDDQLIYTPAPGFTGSDSFSYTISDGKAAAVATVKVTVEASTSNPTYTLKSSATELFEGDRLSISVATTDVPSSTPLYWSLSGTGVTSSDFSDGVTTGTGAVGADGRYAFSTVLAVDSASDPNESLQVKFFSDAERTAQVGDTLAVMVKELTAGNPTDATDIIQGTANDASTREIISGIPVSSGLRGKQSVDFLTGLEGPDTFVLGDALGTFYDDGIAAQKGSGDLGVILDFSSGDLIQLHGSPADYKLSKGAYTGGGFTNMRGLFVSQVTPGSVDEVVGFIKGASLDTLSLTSYDQFIYAPSIV